MHLVWVHLCIEQWAFYHKGQLGIRHNAVRQVRMSQKKGQTPVNINNYTGKRSKEKQQVKNTGNTKEMT